MNRKILIGILLTLLLVGALFIILQRESDFDSESMVANNEENEIEENLTQDHLDEAFADLEYVENTFIG